MDGRQVKREAKFRAGLILESVMQAGWAGDPNVVETYGQEAADRISDEILSLASRLIESSGAPS
jgi:hypothetical protein